MIQMTQMKLSDIGKIVAGARFTQGWSQSELAARSDVSRATISLLENGKRHDISWGKLMRLLAALDIQVSYESAVPVG
jgi:transcriptional regulator with XRE-family HTH domain